APLLQTALDPIDHRLDRLDADRPLLARALQAGDDLHAVERLASAVLLHDERERLLGTLVRREPPRALQALAAATDDVPLLRKTRVDDLVLEIAAEGALHRTAVLARERSALGGALRIDREATAEIRHLVADRAERGRVADARQRPRDE